jgi:hypothetical protein
LSFAVPRWQNEHPRAGVRWLNIHDGTIGEPQQVLSGTGEDVVKRFDPRWIIGKLRP